MIRVGAGPTVALMNELGLVSASPAVWMVNASAPVSQTIYGWPHYLYKGQTVTGASVTVGGAGAGATPTTIRLGLSGPNVAGDTTSMMLARTAGQQGSAKFTSTGPADFPFSTAYEVTQNGLYYANIVQNGSWGTTQATFARYSAATWSSGPLVTGGLNTCPGQTGQTDLPNVGVAWTISAAAALGIVVNLY